MGNIVYISSIPWSYCWHRQQEIMSYFSKNGFRVLFVEPVDKRHPLNRKIMHLADNIWSMEMPGLPFERCSRLINFINGKIALKHIKRALYKLGFSDYIVWFDRVHGIDQRKLCMNHFVIYDLVDEILAFGRFKNKKLLLNLENNILKKADLLISSSKTLLDKKIKQSNRTGDSLFLPNGVDCSRFTEHSHQKTIDIERLTIGFVGTISSRSINFNLVNEMAKIRPKWKFVFIGPGTVEDKNLLKNQENIFVKDAIKGEDIPRTIDSFDIGIIPYNILGDSMDYVFPRKACEYLAAGKLVVSTPLNEVKYLYPYVLTAETASGFIETIETNLFCKTSCERVEFARQFDWDTILKKLLDKIFAYSF